MSYDYDNVFARILRGELPCVKLYEDDQTLAFMDIMPQAEGHALVVPKEPAADLLSASPAAAAACIQTTQRIARAVKQALAAPGIQIVQMNGAAAGQTVPHLHFHVIPRRPGENLKFHASAPVSPEKLEPIAQKIRAALQTSS
ncbi:MAG: HIT family protein [Steroidobacteraceae bacterium]|nr:HIT family protein [Steroidobacteraceae bacterium]MDW8258666.1 HIT family protein [Gammaproteobacteria bacterium]